MSYSFSAKKYFLTYSQCPAPKETLLEFLRTRRGIEKYIIGREPHADGGFHLHCVVIFEGALRSKKVDYLDLWWEDKKFHPNIQVCRTNLDVIKTRNYSMKDGDFIESDNWDDITPPEKRSWSEVVGASSREDMMNLAREISPRDYVLQHDRLISYANRMFPVTERVYATPSCFKPFQPPSILENWRTEYVKTVLN